MSPFAARHTLHTHSTFQVTSSRNVSNRIAITKTNRRPAGSGQRWRFEIASIRHHHQRAVALPGELDREGTRARRQFWVDAPRLSYWMQSQSSAPPRQRVYFRAETITHSLPLAEETLGSRHQHADIAERGAQVSGLHFACPFACLLSSRDSTGDCC
jgi:hypothetical protein